MSDAPKTIWVKITRTKSNTPEPDFVFANGSLWEVNFDPHYQYRRADLPPTDAECLRNEKVRALVEALRYMVNHAEQLERLDGVYWEATEISRAVLAALLEVKE